jgi:small conductance mechanosensitive channel
MKRTAWKWLLWSANLLVLISAPTVAAECPADIEPLTTTDPEVPVEVLTHRVTPLTQCELETEAQAWLLLLKDKVIEISDAEVAAFYKKEEAKAAEKAEEAQAAEQEAQAAADFEGAEEAEQQAQEALEEARVAAENLAQDSAVQQAIEATREETEGESANESAMEQTAEAKAEVKTALVRHATGLMTQRTALIDRLNVILGELKAKGGDTAEYDTYINAVSGLTVDVTDASATWTTISGWLMSPEGGFRWAANMAQFAAILISFYLLSILAGKATRQATSRAKNFSSLLRDFLVVTARRLVFFVGFFVGLSALEVNIGPVLAVVGAAGFVIAFALQNSLSNFASGILMLLYRPFDVGDLVNVAGVLGKVESMNLLSTQLRTPDNQLIIVPNNSVWGDVITNVTGITERRVDMMFGIGYDDDIDKAQKILEDIVNAHERVLKERETIVKLHELADSSVNFVCRPWAKPDDYWNVYWDITREVKRRFDAEGISIPFPQRDVHLYQETPSAT